jgi:hypothetical protein
VTPADNSLRLTFDRRIHGVRYEGSGCLDRKGLTVYPEIAGVVLEIKFTNRFPVWMRTMVRNLDLERRSMAKYVACIMALRSPHVRAMEQRGLGVL